MRLPELRISLLGPINIACDGHGIRLPTRKDQSLLAYLVLHPEVHGREKLAALLWGDASDREARGSLRAALAAFRRAFGPDILLAGRDTVQINRAHPLWVDARVFERQAKGALADQVAEPASIELGLYRGELLVDLYDDWIPPERQYYYQLYVDVLVHLARSLMARAEYSRAADLARQALAADPADEAAHRALITCHLTLGDRHAALRQYEACLRSLRQELGVEPSPETQALYLRARARAATAPVSAAGLGNLPRPLTSFVGRAAELQRLKALLTGSGTGPTGAARLATLTGPGGSGKTRLAIQAAGDASPHYPDGVWWVDLAPVVQAQAVSWTIAKVLGLRDRGAEAIEEQLVQHLQRRRALLILDNCEHVIDESARLAELLLIRCPALQILATSREALNVPGEAAWPVAPLALPEPGAVLDPAALLAWEGVHLFNGRWRQPNISVAGAAPREGAWRRVPYRICWRASSISRLCWRCRQAQRCVTGCS